MDSIGDLLWDEQQGPRPKLEVRLGAFGSHLPGLTEKQVLATTSSLLPVGLLRTLCVSLFHLFHQAALAALVAAVSSLLHDAAEGFFSLQHLIPPSLKTSKLCMPMHAEQAACCVDPISAANSRACVQHPLQIWHASLKHPAQPCSACKEPYT